MSPESIVCWQELRAKKSNSHTVPEDMEYKKLQMERNADVLTLNELERRAELTKAIVVSSMNSSDIKSTLNGVIQSEIGKKQKPYSREDTTDFVNIFLAKIKQEVTMQDHK